MSITLTDEDIAIIDERIRLAQKTTRTVGTCVQRDTVGPWAQVIFDGSTIAMPVRVMGNVSAQENFRVILDKYGTDWFVTGSFATPSLGYSRAFNFGDSTFIQATGSYTDVGFIAPIPFTKFYDLTRVRMAVNAGCYAATTAPDSARWGLRFTPQGSQVYTPTDYHTAFVYHNNLGVHLTSYGMQDVVIPAGDYLVQVRWYQPSGAGVVRTDINDLYTVEISERVDESTPNL